MGNCFGFGNSSTYLLEPDADDNYDEEEDPSINVDPPMPTYYLSPAVSIPASQLTEDEQLLIVKRIHMLQFLPLANYIPVNKDKLKECIICMNDLKLGDEVRYLPCLHTYHRICIDDWLMRSFCCPTCLLPLEPDALRLAQQALNTNHTIQPNSDINSNNHNSNFVNNTNGNNVINNSNLCESDLPISRANETETCE